MRKIFVALTLVLATSFAAFAQKPTAGSKGFTFGVSNIFQNGSSTITNSGPGRTGTLMFRYYVADGLAARLSVNYSRTANRSIDTTNIGRENTLKTSSGTFAIQLGAQKSLGDAEKFEPYIAGDLYFAKTSRKYNFRSEVVNAQGGETVGNYNETTANGTPIFDNTGTFQGYDGPSTSIGIIPALGFNYFFNENFAIGAEFGWGLILSSQGKAVEEEITGTGVTTTKNYFNNQLRTSTIGTTGNGTLTVSVFF